MKHAVCNEMFECWNTSEGFDFARCFSFAASCGYRGVEIAPFTIHTDAFSISAHKRMEICRLARHSGITITGLHWLLAKTEGGYYLTSPDPVVQQKTADYFIALTRLCADLEGSIMVCGSPKQRSRLPGVSYEQAMNNAVATLEKVVPFLEKCGVTIALEPLSVAETDFLTTAAETVELIERIGAPKQIALHLDCKAMSAETTPIPNIIRQNRKHLVYFHVNDPNLLAPGFGALDFVPILASLKEIGYDGWLSLEPFDFTPGVEKLCRDSILYLKECLG